MGNINFEGLAIMALGVVISQTQTEVNTQVDKAAAAIVAAVKNSNTKIDDEVAGKLLVPALKRLVTAIEQGLAG